MVRGNQSILPFFNTASILAAIGLVFFLISFAFQIADDKSGLSWLYLLIVFQLAPFILCVTRGHYDYMAFILFNHFVTYSLSKFEAPSYIDQ